MRHRESAKQPKASRTKKTKRKASRKSPKKSAKRSGKKPAKGATASALDEAAHGALIALRSFLGYVAVYTVPDPINKNVRSVTRLEYAHYLKEAQRAAIDAIWKLHDALVEQFGHRAGTSSCYKAGLGHAPPELDQAVFVAKRALTDVEITEPERPRLTREEWKKRITRRKNRESTEPTEQCSAYGRIGDVRHLSYLNRSVRLLSFHLRGGSHDSPPYLILTGA